MPAFLPRGVYLAPYLDADTGRPVILLIGASRRCVHSFPMLAGELEADALERGRELLGVMDPPPRRRVTL